MNEKLLTKKGQSAFEFITTYGWAILILAVVITLLYYFIGIPSTSVPNKCQFLFGSNCQGIIATSLASSTKMTLVITNAQSYPIFNPLIKVATDSYGNLSAACLPANALVNPGSEIICNVTIPQKISPGTTITGTIYLNITACPSGNIKNCQPEQLQTYKGNIITRVTSQSSNIHLTSTSISSTSTSSTSTTSTSTSTSTSSTSSTSTSTSTSTVLCPPGSQSYTTAGTFHFTTPSGCGTSITYTISLVGGGGGGGNAPQSGTKVILCPNVTVFAAGDGGGGGGYATGSVSGIPSGSAFAVAVGKGGITAVSHCGASLPGGNSSVVSSYFTINALGGAGLSEYNTTGAVGGTYTCSGMSCTGNNGGTGGVGYFTNTPCCVSYGGNGGNSGSPGNGGNGAITNTAGGSPTNSSAGSGSVYGGGGGGGSASITSSLYTPDHSGANGAGGEVIISWN